MTIQIEPNEQNKILGSKSQPNQQTAGGFNCGCDICEPSSWARISKHLDVEISRTERNPRLSGSVIPGGCFGPRVIKRRYEEIRDTDKRGIFEGF
jgi:hypothetical protein